MEMMVLLLLMIENIYIYISIYLSIYLINKIEFLSVYLCQRSLAHARSFADLRSLSFFLFGCLSLFGSALHLPFLATSFHFKNRSFCYSLLAEFCSSLPPGSSQMRWGFLLTLHQQAYPGQANICTLMKQNRIYLLNCVCELFGVKCGGFLCRFLCCQLKSSQIGAVNSVFANMKKACSLKSPGRYVKVSYTPSILQKRRVTS